MEKVKLFAIEQNVSNLVVKTNIGSGLNDNRKNLLSLLDMVQKGEVNRIFRSVQRPFDSLWLSLFKENL